MLTAVSLVMGVILLKIELLYVYINVFDFNHFVGEAFVWKDDLVYVVLVARSFLYLVDKSTINVVVAAFVHLNIKS
jgi:hypothetical protein